LAQQFVELYQKKFKQNIPLKSMAGAVEVLPIVQKYPDIQAISYGVEMYDFHTPKERVSIASIKKCYDFMCDFLQILK